jgi:hypothetical protein
MHDVLPPYRTDRGARREIVLSALLILDDAVRVAAAGREA